MAKQTFVNGDQVIELPVTRPALYDFNGAPATEAMLRSVGWEKRETPPSRGTPADHQQIKTTTKQIKSILDNEFGS